MVVPSRLARASALAFTSLRTRKVICGEFAAVPVGLNCFDRVRVGHRGLNVRTANFAFAGRLG